MKGRSIALHLAVMFGLSVAIVSSVAGVAINIFQADELRRHKMEELTGRYALVERIAESLSRDDWDIMIDKLRAFTPADDSLRFIIESPEPAFAYGLDFLEAAQFDRPEEGFGTARTQSRPYVTLSRYIEPLGTRPRVRLTVALGTSDIEQAQAVLAIGVVVISALAILAVSLLGWLIARRGLAPVGALSAHARLLGEGDLSQRLPAERLPSELEGLVFSLNQALGRVQTTYQKLSAFNADVAHELRTPVSNLIGETQVALSRQRSASDLEAVLQSNLEELERLKSIINDMLFLARADEGDLAGNLIDCSLAEETRKSADFMELAFEEAGTVLEICGDARARINQSLYRRAITNLLDNAIRHGTNGHVGVSITERGGQIEITSENDAAPLPPDVLDRLFDRFFRGDPARTGSEHTHGLGLAIVKAIARMHGGEVFARQAAGRIRIGLTLPVR
ncbi:heavy metal sensor histidine kinase [Hyphomonas neptunium ATCC 15444]|uniref:Sensor protein n=2 Tax=Hyphomonas TaxID=85 RepID=Q0C058_HYPNA|nr:MULTISPECIES: heavy metal sensor histidine kinase [Hyphomonas]ABI77100.1 heavy metal sensor histidine kinase [Hyphomonas neptunium ATCC 15444]KCZ90532.1 heavy metal sensor histidine kinase [Hyphomonas hirschiana VP5]